MREEGDGRGRNDSRRRYMDERGRSDYIRFGMRVGTVGFRKKILLSHIYVFFQKNKIK